MHATMNFWPNKKISCPERWHALGVAPVKKKLVQHHFRLFGHIQWSPVEALVLSRVIRQAGIGKRGRGRPNMTMWGVCEEWFKGLEYHQGASIISERVEATNSYVRTLIFGSSYFITFLLVFYSPIFAFLFVFFYFPPYLFWFFITLPSLSLLFCPYFFGSCEFHF
jgi:hypothetical protein